MKIKITGKKSLITHVSIDDSNKLVYSFLIDTKKNVKLKHTESAINYFSFYYGKRKKEVAVSLIAENKKDKEILDRLIFKSIAKNQHWFVFVSDSLLGT